MWLCIYVWLCLCLGERMYVYVVGVLSYVISECCNVFHCDYVNIG